MKVVVLICDSEGVDGTKEYQKTIDAYVTRYSLKLSTLHIVNVMRYLGAHDLEPLMVSAIYQPRGILIFKDGKLANY